MSVVQILRNSSQKPPLLVFLAAYAYIVTSERIAYRFDVHFINNALPCKHFTMICDVHSPERQLFYKKNMMVLSLRTRTVYLPCAGVQSSMMDMMGDVYKCLICDYTDNAGRHDYCSDVIVVEELQRV